MAVEEYLYLVVGLVDVVFMVVVDAEMDESGQVFTPLIALHLRISISKLKLSNILKNNSGSCLHIRNIKFIR